MGNRYFSNEAIEVPIDKDQLKVQVANMKEESRAKFLTDFFNSILAMADDLDDATLTKLQGVVNSYKNELTADAATNVKNDVAKYAEKYKVKRERAKLRQFSKGTGNKQTQVIFYGD